MPAADAAAEGLAARRREEWRPCVERRAAQWDGTQARHRPADSAALEVWCTQ